MKKLQRLATALFFVACLFSSVSQAEIHTIDILVLHPPKNVLDTDILTRVASMESYANKALENSQANIRFRVVKIEEINIPDPNADSATLSALKSSQKVQELRAKYRADLVTMITPTDASCGRGYVLGGTNHTMYSAQKNFGFNVVADRCISSFAHELGHNLGLAHSSKVGETGGLYSWGRGHGKQKEFVTTMAYTSIYNANRLQFFSNPDITRCNGLTCGKSIALSDGANAVKAINVSGPQIAAWFDSNEIIAGINLSPYATEDYAVTHTNEAVEIAVLENDGDPESDAITLDSVGEAKHGSTSITSGIIKYIPESGFVGEDNFQYTIKDAYDNSVSTTVTVNVGWGVNYQYFQGNWNEVPGFINMPVLKKGISHNFSLEQRLRDSDFGFRYFARIQVPETGNYQFFLTSDDGSKLFIDDTLITNNDGLHGAVTKNNAVNLNAGLHQIEVHFFQASGSQRLNVEWQGPGFERQIISNDSLRLDNPENSFPVVRDDEVWTTQNTEITIDVLKNDKETDADKIQLISSGMAENGQVTLQDNKLTYQPDFGFSGTDHFSYLISDGQGGEDSGLVTVHVGQGVSYQYYEGDWGSLPDFNSLIPIASGTQQDFSLSNRNRDDNFAFRFHSGIEIPEDDRYYFYMVSDDTSKIYIDGELVVNNDGKNGQRWEHGKIDLAAGIHKIEVQYFEKTGGERLAIYWGGNKMKFQKLLANKLRAID